MAGIQFPQFNQFEPKLDGLAGNFQAEPRVFVHDATNVVLGNVASLHTLSGGDTASLFVDGTTMATTSSGAGTGLTLNVKATPIVGGVGGVVTGVYVVVAGGADTTAGPTVAYVVGDSIGLASPGAGANATLIVGSIDIPNTQKRGVCLYVGVAGDVGVELESGNTVTFLNVAAGSFLPVLAKRVTTTITATGDILALY